MGHHRGGGVCEREYPPPMVGTFFGNLGTETRFCLRYKF